jgi:hypothetical protein
MKRFFQRLFIWEKWSYDVIYLPIDIWWLYYAIRARHFWYFTPVNPSLVFAGFEGGSKKEMYDQLPGWCKPVTLLIDPGAELQHIEKQMNDVSLQYPVVVKPDTGMQGVLFRIIQSTTELQRYHQRVGEPYILQTFVDLPFEFSVFHIRYPGEQKGIVTGLILKDYLHVSGNGKDSLGTLIAAHPKAKYKLEEMERKHAPHWDDIINDGEKYFLSLAGNHNHGAKFINLNHVIDQQLTDVFDRISVEAGKFYFGRYDLKCTALEDLKLGKNIEILEYNGAGAAITHVFDRNMSYFGALREILKHWRHLYRIGLINHRTGVPYWSFRKGYRFMMAAKKNYRRMKQIDQTLP